jgi:hypothetical protein
MTNLQGSAWLRNTPLAVIGRKTANPPPGTALRDELRPSVQEKVCDGGSTSFPGSDGCFVEGIEFITAKNDLESAEGLGWMWRL